LGKDYLEGKLKIFLTYACGPVCWVVFNKAVKVIWHNISSFFCEKKMPNIINYKRDLRQILLIRHFDGLKNRCYEWIFVLAYSSVYTCGSVELIFHTFLLYAEGGLAMCSVMRSIIFLEFRRQTMCI